MSLKVGDTVIIKRDLIVDEIYNGLDFVEAMVKYKGKTAQIIKKIDDVYKLDIDKEDHYGFGFHWTEPMFETRDLIAPDE